MTVLVGGMRVLNTNFDHSQHGVFTHNPEALTNDFFVKPAGHSTKWAATSDAGNLFEGVIVQRRTQVDWYARRPHLCSNSELRALAEVYACEDAKEKFVQDFVSAWAKVITLSF